MYIHTLIDFLILLMGQIESYKQCYMYNNIQIDVCFEIEQDQIHIRENTKPAARKTQIFRQEEKKNIHTRHRLQIYHERTQVEVQFFCVFFGFESIQ